MGNEVLLSLCIPTNGIIEWVIPVLNSIYQQGIKEEEFEVIVTDNGDNDEFARRMDEYKKGHKNLFYKKTNVYMFDNQLEALRLAKGVFLKFINHRTVLKQNALKNMMLFIEENMTDKPVIYFSNGVLKLKDQVAVYYNFDEFVRGLSYFASWTTGVGIWKEDFDRIPENKEYNKISPHSGVLFSERHKKRYLINDRFFMEEIDSDHSKKGNYDLFKAFAVEEIYITLGLFCDGDISNKTFQIVKNAYKIFVCNLYIDFCILKKPCSYDLMGFDDVMGIFFSKGSIRSGIMIQCCKRAVHKVRRFLGFS